MDSRCKSLTRRRFMAVGSAAIASPLILNLMNPLEQAMAAAKKANKDRIYYITDQCIGCHSCKVFCPQKAIYYGERKMEIDQDKCVQCGTCFNECPICVIDEIRL